MQYFVYSSLQHDGTKYERGSKISLDEKTAETLLSSNVIGSKPVSDTAPSEEAASADRQNDTVTVGGNASSSGEPSLDKGNEPAQRAEAEDVTPEVSERMTREELEAIAKSQGLSDEVIANCKTKANLVELIEEKRAGTTATEADPSADL